MMLGVCLSSSRTREFDKIQRNGIELRTGKILEEHLVQFAFQKSLEDKFTIQQDNNLKQGQIYTWVAYRDDIDVPERPNYSFDLNLVEKLTRL
jgi:hypothetical protein